MKRSETTKFLSRLLEKSRFSGPGKYWAREVSLDYGYAAGKPRRVDYMQFIPENQCSISAIEKGIFTCYEIKSCKEDIYSGNQSVQTVKRNVVSAVKSKAVAITGVI